MIINKTKWNQVELHPTTLKQFKAGHHLVIKDQYTDRFPDDSIFLKTAQISLKKIYYTLQDSSHPKVKARLWKILPYETEHLPNIDFYDELAKRIAISVDKRKRLGLLENRNNFYLIFGEQDQLPGLHVQLLGDIVLVQYYAFYWSQLEQSMYKALHQAIKQFFPELKIKDYIRQSRNPDKKSVYSSLKNKNIEPTTIEEFGVKFKIKFNEHYDIGIYSDMSALRGEIIKKLKPESHFLNLFSYTGAFSLQAAKKKIYTTSVDLSKKFLDWSEENRALNPDITEDYLENICGDALKVTSKFVQEKRVFDSILMDPPSFSSNKKKGSNALDSYKSFLPLFDKILSNDGSLFIFLNNHSEKRKKFEETIEGIIKNNRLNLKINKKFKLIDDCKLNFPYPEADYLKGFELIRNK